MSQSLTSEAQARRGGVSSIPGGALSSRFPSFNSNIASGAKHPGPSAARGIDAAAFNQAVQKLNETLTQLPTVAVVKF
jgi:hypothetical protein